MGRRVKGFDEGGASLKGCVVERGEGAKAEFKGRDTRGKCRRFLVNLFFCPRCLIL